MGSGFAPDRSQERWVMDQKSSPEHTETPLKPARVALNVLALCFALSVIGRGLGESFTVFLKPISESFGWDRAQVVSVYSLAALAGGLASPLIGRLFDRSGPRAVYSLGLLLLGGAFLIAAHAQQLWQFQLSLGLCVGFGIALIGNVPNSILLGRWFGPRLPTAMAVVYSATGAGVLILLPASQILIDKLGCCRCCCCRGACSLPARRISPRAPRPTSPTKVGPCWGRCATTPSGRCSPRSFSPRSGCMRYRRRWLPI
jgi:hypothetical protein